MVKQFLIDIVVVLATPLLLIGGYYIFKTDGEALLSVNPFSTIQKNEVDLDLGKKTEAALALLSTIRLDNSLFSDPGYLLLQKYTVEIPSVELGRSFPFTPPPVLVEMNRRSQR